MLTQKQKDEWVAALRSGKYKQSENVLCRETETGDRWYCCIGVLCETLGAPRVTNNLLGTARQFVLEHKKWTSSIPDTVLSCDIQDILIRLNDTENRSFDEIADWIKQNVEVSEG